MSAIVRDKFGEKPFIYEISIRVDEGQSYAKLLKKASKLVRQLDPDACWVSGITWSESRDAMVLTVIVSNPHPKCVTCKHRDAHNAGGIGVCRHAACGCDGPCA